MRPYGDESEHPSDAADELDEHHLIDEICARLLAQPATYVSPDGHSSFFTTATWEGEQLRVPPASEAQLRVTEAQLGFSLPPFLRALYSRVANGGYRLGPTYDFYGAEGGWRSEEYQALDPEWPIGLRVSRTGWRFHERIEAALMEHPGGYVVSDEVPEGFIEVANYGCGMAVDVDRFTDRVYLTGYAGAIPLDDNEELWLGSIEFLAPSLAEWFRRWLDPTHEDVPQQSGELTGEYVDLSGIQQPELVWRGLYRVEWQSPEEEPEIPPGNDLPWWYGAAHEAVEANEAWTDSADQGLDSGTEGDRSAEDETR